MSKENVGAEALIQSEDTFWQAADTLVPLSFRKETRPGSNRACKQEHARHPAIK